MKKYPAIALIEFSSIATGIMASDAMVKKSPITMLRTGTISKGKYLILIGGSVSSVEEAYFEGTLKGGDVVDDKVLLPDIHQQVHDAILGTRKSCTGDGLSVIETRTVASIIKSSDAAIKATNIDIVEIRLGDALGGKGVALFTGTVEDLEYAVEVAKSAVSEQQCWLNEIIIPRLHEHMSQQIAESTRFAKVKTQLLKDGELPHVAG